MANMDEAIGKWIPQCHGNREQHEISIVRKDNDHGRKSWGWGNRNKIVIACNIMEKEIPQYIFEALLFLAMKSAEKQNELEAADKNLTLSSQ